MRRKLLFERGKNNIEKLTNDLTIIYDIIIGVIQNECTIDNMTQEEYNNYKKMIKEKSKKFFDNFKGHEISFANDVISYIISEKVFK